MENKEKKRNEELQTRRDFFKKAAKGLLPVIGAVVLSHVPLLSQAAENNEEMGCQFGCSGGCSGSCGRGCSYDCTNSCRGYCTGGCKGSCSSYCTGSCSGSCKGWSN